jgi:predicted nucleotidyltransferase
MDKAIRLLNELKNKDLIVDYAIGGGIAAIFYVEPFLTYDLDVFIIPTVEAGKKKLISLTPIYDYLKKKGCVWKGEHIIIGEVPVQFIPVDELEEEAVKNAKTINYKGVKTKVLTPEYLIAVLVRAGRKKDIAKVEKLMMQTKLNQPKVQDILQRYGLKEKSKHLFK